MKKNKNQCDGCIAGHPIENGIHIVPYPSGSMRCQAFRYIHNKDKSENEEEDDLEGSKERNKVQSNS